MLQHEDWVGELGTFHEQIIGVLRCTWSHHDEPRVVGKPRFNHVRMERPRPSACAQWNSDGHWTIGAPSPTKHGSVVDKGIEPECSESSKLDFDHRFHARKCSTNAGVNNDGLAQGHVDEFVRVSSVLQRHVHSKSTGNLHVLSDENTVITMHGGHVCHGLLNGSSVRPTSFLSV